MKVVSPKYAAASLLDICRDVSAIERACVSGYMAAKGIAIPRRSFLRGFLSGVDGFLAGRCRDILLSITARPTLETLIELFELLVACDARKKNGVAYTPLSVKKMMLTRVLCGAKAPTVFDPSCGCASFLLTAAHMIHEKSGLKYRDVIRRCIFGADIDGGALDKTRALFALLLAENGEDGDIVPTLFKMNMLNRESVDHIRSAHKDGFDCVIGNPPYVRFRNMDEDTKSKVSQWTVAKCGNADLYMPFFEVGMSLTSQRGTLSYITSNTYLQSVNGRCLRNWMVDKKFSVEITDFRDAQLFANVTCYTCVTTLSRHGSGGISYRRAESPDCENERFSSYRLSAFRRDAPWRMQGPEIESVIRKLEGVGTPLSHYVIRNGLATLANGVFFFRPIADDGKYFRRLYNGREWKIEKSLCRKVIKPNVVHNEAELMAEMEYAIFPYSQVCGKFVIRSEEEMCRDYPCAYAFLASCRDVLDGRDKGKGVYPAWYAYGRTQGMNCTGCKLLIPYIAGAGTAVLSTDRDLMFYCGYALINDNVDELKYIKAFIESKAFWYFIYHTSKPYSKGFMALAKNYITRFSIPSLSDADKKALLSADTVEEHNRLIWKAYGIDPRKGFATNSHVSSWLRG